MPLLEIRHNPFLRTHAGLHRAAYKVKLSKNRAVNAESFLSAGAKETIIAMQI